MPTLVTLVDGTVPVAADFNGNYTALNNAIGSGTAISAWATGEIPYASGANTLARLTAGSFGQVLTMGASIPAWSAAAGVVDQLCGLTLSNNVGDATNDIDISVGVAASEDATYANRVMMSLTSAITKRLDATWVVGTNQGGLDTGSPSNTTYHVFLIQRVDTGVVDVLFSLSATAPTLPTSYTKQRRIGSILREGGAIVAFSQDGDEFLRSASKLDIDVTNAGTSAVSRTLSVPLGIKVRAIVNVLATHVGTNFFVYLSSLDQSDEAASETSAITNHGSSNASDPTEAAQFKLRTNTSAQVRTRQNTSGAGDIFRMATVGWWDRRGKG